MAYIFEGNNSTTEGVGPSLSIPALTIQANEDEVMLIFVATTEIGGSPASHTTPSGWTLEATEYENDLRMSMFKRVAPSDGTSFPAITLTGTNSEWTIIGFVFDDADIVTDSFGLGDVGSNNNTNNTPNLTAEKANSWFLQVGAIEDQTSGFTGSLPITATKLDDATQSTGSSEGIDHTMLCVINFPYNSATDTITGSTFTTAGDDKCTFHVEIFTNGNTAPAVVTEEISSALPGNSQETDDEYLKDMLVGNNTLFDGTTPSTWTFNAATGVAFGGLANVVENAGGSGYTLDDVLTIAGGGGSGGTVKVTRVSSGAVIDVRVVAPGSGYSNTTGASTTGGTGTGCTIDIEVGHVITISSHGFDESTVVLVDEGAGTLPTGMNDNEFYFVRPVSANEIQLVETNPDADNAVDYYCNNRIMKDVAPITAVGSGTITLTEARCINGAAALLDFYRFQSGATNNATANSGGWIGDAGYNQNWIFTTLDFSSTWDSTDETFSFNISFQTSSRIPEVYFWAMDSDNDWMSWKIYDLDVHGPTATATQGNGGEGRQFQFDKASVQALASHEEGTFDATKIEYLGMAYRGGNISITRPGNMTTSDQVLLGTIKVAGGLSGSKISMGDVTELAIAKGGLASQPSDLQFTYLQPLQIGDPTLTNTFFEDSEKSLAFPPLADAVATFENYLDILGFFINAGASDEVSFRNSQVGASVPYSFEVTMASGADVDIDGNTYVFGTVTLDADQGTVSRQLFVGGEGVTDNNVPIRSSTFVVNDQIGAGNGVIDWTSTTDIEDSAFEADTTLTDGHAIIINATGTYTFENLTFTGFGADGTDTAAVYNNSGGSVTINVNDGTTPTVRNGAGASTTVVSGAVTTLVRAIETDGTPIQDARVYLTAGAGGPLMEGTVIISGTTNVNGEISDSRSLASDQPVTGRVRKSSASPFYKSTPLVDTIDSNSGVTLTAVMILDE